MTDDQACAPGSPDYGMCASSTMVAGWISCWISLAALQQEGGRGQAPRWFWQGLTGSVRWTRGEPRGCLAYGVLPQTLAFQGKGEQGNHILWLPLITPLAFDDFNPWGLPGPVVVFLFNNLQWISFPWSFPVSLDQCTICIHNILGKVFSNYTMCCKKRYELDLVLSLDLISLICCSPIIGQRQCKSSKSALATPLRILEAFFLPTL